VIAVHFWSGSAALAQDDNWAATLAPPIDGTAYGTAEALAIQVPGQLPFEVLLQLGLEVDAIDVTPLLTFENPVFRYNPPQALSPGQHRLRLVATRPGGDIIDRGSWTIEVVGSGGRVAVAPGDPVSTGEGEQRISLAAVNAMELSQRLADSGMENLPDRLQTSGGGYGSGSYSNGPWSMTSNGNYLVQTEETRTPSGRTVDLGEYELTGRFDGEEILGRVALGHQDLGADNFIMSGFHRRGLSASLGSANEVVSVTGFGFRPDATTGRQDFTGLNDDDSRLVGFTATTHPVPDWGTDFAVTGIYYSGEGNDLGTGGGGDVAANQGNGWGLVAERYLLDRSVQVKGQFAQTDFEYGGVVLGDNDETSNAWSLALAYSPVQGEEVGGEYMNLTLGAQYDRVETFFSSLANPSLAADRDGVLLYSNFFWGSVSANAQGLYQTNNVDDVTGVPTDRLLSFQFSGNYYPTIDPAAAGETDWLGQPYLNVNLGIADNDRSDTPSVYAGTSTDNQNRAITLGGGSNHARWGWQVSETFSQYEDNTGNASDTNSYLTDFSASWTVSDAVQLDGNLQWGLFQDRDGDNDTHTINLNLGVQAELIPETLKSKVNYNLNLLTGDGDTPDSNIVSGEVEWTLFPPRENSIGAALAFQGLLEKKNGTAEHSLDGTDWQVYSVLRISAPLAY
jgi:hypothetical protein